MATYDFIFYEQIAISKRLARVQYSVESWIDELLLRLGLRKAPSQIAILKEKVHLKLKLLLY